MGASDQAAALVEDQIPRVDNISSLSAAIGTAAEVIKAQCGVIRQSTSEISGYLYQAGELIAHRHADRLTEISTRAGQAMQLAEHLFSLVEALHDQEGALVGELSETAQRLKGAP